MGNRRAILLGSLFLFISSVAFSAGPAPADGKEAKFDAGKFIVDHVIDSYDWHVASLGDFHLSLPLPVILRSQHSGWHFFLSSEFHHGHSSHNGFEIASSGPYSGKIVEQVNGEQIRPLDLSVTKIVAAMLISCAILFLIFISIAGSYKKRAGLAPKGMQSFFEPLILFIRDDIAKPCIGEAHFKTFMPFLLSVFFFIFFNNLLGLVPLLPGGANVTGSISVAMVLALFTFFYTNISGNKGYWAHIFNTPGVPWWLKYPLPLMPIIEVMGMLTKPFVLMVRLSANITAGHIICLGFISLIFVFGQMSAAAGFGASILSVVFYIFMTFLEILVAFIQAYVFTMLSALFFGMAKVEDHHH
jgi:F-type H+-transporting ATPase subunit a